MGYHIVKMVNQNTDDDGQDIIFGPEVRGARRKRGREEVKVG